MKIRFLRSDSKKPEWIDYALFTVLFAVISVFHEPWFDEAEAWQIAKCASLRDILLKIPHYEGHPPLWHLLLMLPAKLGVPFEVGVKTVAAIPTLLSVWLLLFRSPFPRPVRLILPYHYFVFYQYGVVSRPYGLMLLAFLLAAVCFAQKDTRPWRFMLCLLLLCLTSAYGIVLAGGICICWVLDILREYHWRFSGSLWKDRRIAPLAVLFAAACVLILEILPGTNTLGITYDVTTSLPLRLLYTLLIMLPDSLFLYVMKAGANILTTTFFTYDLIFASFFGVILYAVLFLLSAPRKRIYFAVPMFLFGIFSALVYLFAHHTGIPAILLLFWLWINQQDETRGQLFDSLWTRISFSEKDRKLLRRIWICVLAAVLLVPTIWTVTASVNDILHPYFFGRDTAKFLKESGLSEALILTEWDSPVLSVSEEETEDEEGPDILELIDTNHLMSATTLDAYFDRNIISNLNFGLDEYAYNRHNKPTREENIQNLVHCRKNGHPDVLLGNVHLGSIFNQNEISLADYAPVYKMTSCGFSIWKNSYFSAYNYDYIYLRRDLLEQYGLEEIEADPFLYPYASLSR